MNEGNRVQNLEQQQKIQDINSQFLEDYEVETWGNFPEQETYHWGTYQLSLK